MPVDRDPAGNFLDLAERRGLVSSAAEWWQRIVDVAPTADPQIATMSIRRPGQDRDA